MRQAVTASGLLVLVTALAACRTNVTYDVTIENPYADVQGVTATLEVESGTRDVPISGAKAVVQVDIPEIKKSDAMRQLLRVTLHAPLPCGKVDLDLDTQWADEAVDIALIEKNEHPKVDVRVAPGVTPKQCKAEGTMGAGGVK